MRVTEKGRSVVEARGLGLTFETSDGPVHALSDVDLDIGKGEFVSFIGPSGCGKTTFLRVIADLEQPTAGSITVNGISPREAREKRAYGYVFQAAALYPWRTIEKNIALPLEVIGLSKQEQAERVSRTLAMVNLTGFEKKFPWQLSGGMQQRASIARALAFDADLLLMDDLVERAERLVHQEQVGIEGESAGDGGALLHAARQLPGELLLEAGQVDHVERALHALGLLLPRKADDLQRQGDVLLDRPPRIERRRLEDIAVGP